MKNNPINSEQMLNEDIEKAGHSAGFLWNELRSAHTRACVSSPVLAILLLDLVGQAVKIDQRIKEVQSVL